MDHEEDVRGFNENDLQFDAPVVLADPGDAVRVVDRLGRVHDVKGVSFADPVTASRAGEPDLLHLFIMSDTKTKCKTQMQQQNDGLDGAGKLD